MLDHVRRQNHPIPELRRQLAHHEILGQKILHRIEPADILDGLPPRRDRWPQRKFHSVEHARHEHAPDELRIQPDRLQRRPYAPPRNRAIRARRHPHRRVFELRRNRRQHTPVHPNIAVRHHHQVVRGRGKHPVEAVHLRIRVRRLPRDNQPRCCRRVLRAQSLNHRDRRVGPAPHREENLEYAILLLEEAAQIFFQPVVHTRERLQDTDGRPFPGRRWRYRPVTRRRHDRQHAVNQRSGHQGQQRQREHF
jgi:hypothetical protein